MMRYRLTHLSDEQLVRLTDGEVHGREEARLREHLAACWSCRLRMREFDDAITEVAKVHRDSAGTQLPSPEGPRALLKARLRELASTHQAGLRPPWFYNARLRRGIAGFAAIGMLLVGAWLAARPGEHNAVPRPDLTPGAVRTIAASEVCSAGLGDNANVIPAVQRQVFAEYGMPDAETRAYEVDYLITPALGGSDDIRNLWPQPYSGSAWNAHVKDALEDRLRRMVCTGQLDLGTAQREIAVNWIAAYKKYFHTPRPLEAHQRFRNDENPE
jgi:hypothetical protein